MTRLYQLVLVSMLLFNGCIPVLLGAGAVAGYSLSNDAAVGMIQMNYSQLWNLCTEKITGMQGEIVDSNQSKGTIKAKLSDNDVTIKIDSMNDTTQRLKVSARKYLLPKPHFAQKVFMRIVQDLK